MDDGAWVEGTEIVLRNGGIEERIPWPDNPSLPGPHEGYMPGFGNDYETEALPGALPIFFVGVFNISGVPEEQLHPFLLIECPRMLFPYLRRIVSDVTRDGGFPPLNLENIDFIQLYRNEVSRRQAQTAADAQPPADA